MYVPVASPASPSSGSAVIWSSAEDSAVLSALMMAGHQEPGLGEGYAWVECRACGTGWQVSHYAKSVG
jgi:hypothetical protein